MAMPPLVVCYKLHSFPWACTISTNFLNAWPFFNVTDAIFIPWTISGANPALYIVSAICAFVAQCRSTYAIVFSNPYYGSTKFNPTEFGKYVDAVAILIDV